MKRITIVGCGWFGLPLAKALIAQGYEVSGTKRCAQDLPGLARAGIAAYALDLDAPQVPGNPEPLAGLFDSDFLLINVPPRLKQGHEEYLNRLRRLKALIGDRQYRRLIFISSTGVYPAQAPGVEPRELTEADASAHSPQSETLLAAEALFGAEPNACVLRFAGLVGPKRHPGRFLAGKKDLPGANVAVNLLHLEDGIRAVSLLLQRTQSRGPIAPVYNLCAPGHPLKGEFYRQAALSLELEPPEFNAGSAPDKRIWGNKICAELGFEYLHGDPYAMLDACR
ncbi:SDR family oxidoreductase [Shewanella salipaludis]|uniref:SDR family oxidoreductase n=1 Tax=Shewanella salipaludis TaxID=2723052 RepID=A0A972FVN6_9GAMM|nr:SDR family oxidoreductase [Shewanella salipaludis]NMH66124.1 SDR family oxidoreductase [Shewanella salipaludis]